MIDGGIVIVMSILKKTLQYIKTIPNKQHAYICMLITLLLLTSCGSSTDTPTPVSSSYNEYNEYEVATTLENDTTTEVEVETEITNDNEEVIPIPESSEDTPKQFSELQIHFIDVGQGDSTLIICDSEAMLIDAGDNDQGTKVQNYLQKQGIESLKYVICTHPDADHIGGMDVILYKFDCETILMTDEEKDTNTYRDVIDTMNGKNYKNTLPIVGKQYSLGNAEFTILAPSRLGDDSNNNSISIILTHGDNKFLFTGDAEEQEENDIINSGIPIDADVYKVGHHGSSSSSSINFLNTISPVYAVISCAEGNSYGHPHAETLNNLRTMGVQVFRTDEQGSIVATSDGTNIIWNCSPSETWQAGESTDSSSKTEQKEATNDSPVEQVEEQPTIETPVEVPATTTYICNTNTGKFHYPNCSSVDQMSEKNKLPVTATRDELINQGYVPCKRCNP